MLGKGRVALGRDTEHQWRDIEQYTALGRNTGPIFYREKYRAKMYCYRARERYVQL